MFSVWWVAMHSKRSEWKSKLILKILFMAAILYGPCLALSQVTGLDSKNSFFVYNTWYEFLILLSVAYYYLMWTDLHILHQHCMSRAIFIAYMVFFWRVVWKLWSGRMYCNHVWCFLALFSLLFTVGRMSDCTLFDNAVRKGFIDIGGIKKVFEIAQAGQRMNFFE